MKDLLMRLVEGEYPKREEIKQVMLGITEEKYPAEQIAALLMALQIKGITPDVRWASATACWRPACPLTLAPAK